MKKFILMIMMSLCMVTMTSAQHVKESGVFDNVYTTVTVGGQVPTTNVALDMIRPTFGVEIGKDITTLYSTGLEFKSGINNRDIHTAFDEFSLVWLHKVNMLNLFDGYKDRNWTLQAVGGLGWGHDNGCVVDNYGVAQAGVEVGYNLSKSWALVAKPNITWNYAGHGLNVNNSDLELAVGVSYKFPNRDGSRGFVVCDRDELNDKINSLRAENEMLNQYLDGQKVINKQQADTISELRKHICDVPDTVFVTKPIGPTIGFTINSAEIDQRHEMNIINIAKEYGDKKIVVKGYADAATGTPEYNMELSGKRAEAVKRLLIKHGVKEENITTKAEGGQINLNPFYTSDYMNRCVLFTIE